MSGGDQQTLGVQRHAAGTARQGEDVEWFFVRLIPKNELALGTAEAADEKFLRMELQTPHTLVRRIGEMIAN